MLTNFEPAIVKFEEIKFRYMNPDDEHHVQTVLVALNGQNIFQVMRHIEDNEKEELNMLVNDGFVKILCMNKIVDKKLKFISVDYFKDSDSIEYIQNDTICVINKV